MEWNELQIQQKWQEKWKLAKAFEPKIEKGKEKFFFTVPYPYVSGLLHVGHGRTYTNGDVIARFRRMQGYNVLWPMAFHITGTPVLAISAKIEAGEADTIRMFEEYVSIYEKDSGKVKEVVKSFTDPWKLVNYFSGKLVNDFTSMGYSIDFSRQFTSGDKEYNKFVQWQFSKYQEKGFIKQASYPILYCTNDKNAVGEDDIKDADTQPVEVQKFVAFKFKLEKSDVFLVSSTLRPDTAFGITNMFINPAGEYAEILVESNGEKWKEKWVVSKKAAEKLGYQGSAVKILREFPGEELVGKKCVSPVGKAVPILPSPFVNPEHASGLVHSVPSDAPFDWVALQEMKKDEKLLARHPEMLKQLEQITPVALISLEGYGEYPAKDLVEKMRIANTREKDKLDKATAQLYKEEFYKGILTPASGKFAGMPVVEAKDKITEWLKKEGKAADFYEISRPAVCRCGGKVVCAVLSDQWFLDYNAPGWKQKARQCLDAMLVYPNVYRKQLQDVFEWLDKRPCARRRGLGTKLPFAHEWIIESLSDSTIYMALYTIIKKIREYKIAPEKLSKELFDYVLVGEGSAVKASVASGVERKHIAEMREEFLYWYPNDLRHTGIAHITNHLSFFIFAHSAIFPKEQWPKGISLNEFIISEGSKMSKSKGNVVMLNSIAQQGMADVFRFYITGAADFSSVLDYRSRDLEVAKKNLARLVTVLSSLVQTRNQTSSAKKQPSQSNNEGNAYAWMASKFEKSTRDATLALEQLRLRDYVQVAVHENLKNYDYLSKRCSEGEKKAFAKEYVLKWITLIAPLVPHAAEELWERAGSKEFVSHAAWPKADEKLILPQVELREDLLGQVISDARSIVQMLSRKPGKKFSKVTVIVCSKGKWQQLLKLLKCESVEKATAQVKDQGLKQYLEKEFYALGYRLSSGELVEEKLVLEQAKGFVEKELGLKFEVQEEEKSPHAKAGKAMPLKPAIVLE